MPRDNFYYGCKRVGFANEVGNKTRCRHVIDFLRGTDLFDPTVAQHGNTIGHRQRFRLVVGYEDSRLT